MRTWILQGTILVRCIIMTYHRITILLHIVYDNFIIEDYFFTTMYNKIYNQYIINLTTYVINTQNHYIWNIYIFKTIQNDTILQLNTN